MEIIPLNSLAQFEYKLKELQDELNEKFDSLLFRGQSDSNWHLDTTMERSLKTPVTLSGYYRFAHTAKAKIETLLDRTWQAPTPPKFDKWLEEKETFIHSDTPGFEYLAYLRHHGFPSPLLDWTASPYAAQFFAYNDCDPKQTDYVAIYCYSEYYKVGKIRSNDQPEIYKFGPYAKVHKRHVLQQSQYTICVEFDDNHQPLYSNHEEVFKRNDKTQDRLWKFIFPSSLRVQAIKKLNMMNINSYSLFGSEDSLVDSIATNEIIKNDL